MDKAVTASASVENGVGELYGKLFVLGCNELTEAQRFRTNSHYSLLKRQIANGIKKTGNLQIVQAPHLSKAVSDKSRHTVSYSVEEARNTTVVEYDNDSDTDMFQIGRSSESQIDFTVIDTNLFTKNNNNDAQSKRLSQEVQSPNKKGDKGKLKKEDMNNITFDNSCEAEFTSTISRYACRILIDREIPHKARIYAAGFDSSNNIFLGEKATKWRKKNAEMDGLTTNGVLILHPKVLCEENHESSQLYNWREVSVDGDIYTLRETRSTVKKGNLVKDEDNILQDGSLIDLCGVTLLFRTAEGLANSRPDDFDPDSLLCKLNAAKPQCPVNLNTLIIPKRRHDNKTNQHQPYAYLSCGHVQGKHAWGHIPVQDDSHQLRHDCPICRTPSNRMIPLSMGIEPAFHMDGSPLDHAFNPCGHIASLATVKYWSRIPHPQGNNTFRPICPFCAQLLDNDKAYIWIIFQENTPFGEMSSVVSSDYKY